MTLWAPLLPEVPICPCEHCTAAKEAKSARKPRGYHWEGSPRSAHTIDLAWGIRRSRPLPRPPPRPPPRPLPRPKHQNPERCTTSYGRYLSIWVEITNSRRSNLEEGHSDAEGGCIGGLGCAGHGGGTVGCCWLGRAGCSLSLPPPLPCR